MSATGDERGRGLTRAGAPENAWQAPPRLLPDEPLPPYSYVTGRFPHPTSDPAGHSYGVPTPQVAPPAAERWRECREYLRGLDLFNHGYYWEAHEAWEAVWHACGRHGPSADFFKGLIKLAAAGVKAREGRPAGVVTHAARSQELFKSVAQQLPLGDVQFFFGFELGGLITLASDLASGKMKTQPLSGAPVEVVFPFVLRLSAA